MKVFADQLGSVFKDNSKKGAESLFTTVREELPKHFAKFRAAKAIFEAKN